MFASLVAVSGLIAEVQGFRGAQQHFCSLRAKSQRVTIREGKDALVFPGVGLRDSWAIQQASDIASRFKTSVHHDEDLCVELTSRLSTGGTWRGAASFTSNIAAAQCLNPVITSVLSTANVDHATCSASIEEGHA